MPRRRNPFHRLIQWLRRRRSPIPEEDEHGLISLPEEDEHRLISLPEEDEHRLTEQRLLEHNEIEQRRLEEQFLREEERLQRQAERQERRQRVRVLYTNQWTESEQDLAQLASESEGRNETHGPGEPIIYRIQLLESPEGLGHIRRGLFTTIQENGVTFRFDLLQMHDGEVTWVVQYSPPE